VPAFKGKDAIRQFWGGFLGMGAINLALFSDDVMQRDDLAVETGHYEVSITPKGAAAATDSGKYVVVWRRIGGQWKLERDIFNTNLPAAK
jgi:ketosteroid isomerase-like protein